MMFCLHGLKICVPFSQYTKNFLNLFKNLQNPKNQEIKPKSYNDVTPKNIGYLFPFPDQNPVENTGWRLSLPVAYAPNRTVHV